MNQITETISQEELEDFLKVAYKAILHRPIDEEGRCYYLDQLPAGKITLIDFMHQLVNSAEFKQCHSQTVFDDNYRFEDDPNLIPFLNDQVKQLVDRITKTEALKQEKYDGDWQEAFGGERWHSLASNEKEYVTLHKQRFFELFNAATILLKGKVHPTVIEFTISNFSSFFKKYFPDSTFITVERPFDQNLSEDFVKRVTKSDYHFPIDLNNEDLLKHSKLCACGPYDLIVFTEVIEHLVVDPVDLLSNLIKLLKPSGYLYLTTPNIFSHHKISQINRRENPLPLYSANDGTWDYAYHFREYCMSELLNMTKAAGGKIDAFYFSGCWDSSEMLASELTSHSDQKSNLVLVASQKNE